MKPQFDFDNLVLGEKIFGLEIIDDVVKVLEIKRKGGKYSVIGYAKQQFDKNAIKDELIKEPEIVAEAIKLAREQARPKRIKTKFVNVVLPDSKVFVRVVKFPAGMTKEEIREAIEWKAKDLIAMPLEKVYWDWHRLSSEDGAEMEVVIAAIEKEYVDAYVETLTLLNLIPVHFDISGNAAARFLFQEKYENTKALLVRIDRNTTTLSLFLNGGIRYQTIVKDVVKGGYTSLVDFTSAKLGISKEEAEKRILNPKEFKENEKELLRTPFEVNFEGLYEEIKNILDFYAQSIGKEGGDSSQEKEANFSGMYLYGKGAKIFGLREYLDKKSNELKSKPQKSSSVSPMLPFISRESLPENLIILGLSLRNLGIFKDLRDLNLVPKKIKSNYFQISIYSSLYKYLKVMFWNVYVIGIILIFAFILTLFYVDNAEEELKSIENIAESQANKELRTDIENVNKVAGKVDVLLDTQVDWDSVYQELVAVKGDGVIYENLIISESPDTWKSISGEKKLTTSPGVLFAVVNGVAQTRFDLQKILIDVEASDIFDDVRMPITDYESSENIQFSLYFMIDTNKIETEEK